MTIPTSIVEDLSSSTASVLDGSIPLILILFGIGIAFFIVKGLIGFLPKR